MDQTNQSECRSPSESFKKSEEFSKEGDVWLEVQFDETDDSVLCAEVGA